MTLYSCWPGAKESPIFNRTSGVWFSAIFFLLLY
jgi:hypothetical protein